MSAARFVHYTPTPQVLVPVIKLDVQFQIGQVSFPRKNHTFSPFCFLAACPNSECLVQNLFAQSTQNMNLRILISGEATGGSLCTRGVPRTNCSTGPMTRPMTRHGQHERAAGQTVGGASPARPCVARVAAARLPVRNVCRRVSLVRMPTAVTACSRMAVLPAVERRAVERLTARRVLRRSL